MMSTGAKEHAIRMQAKRETWLNACFMTEELAAYQPAEVKELMLKLARDFRAKHEELIPKNNIATTFATR